MDHSLPGSSLHGISQARILEWVAILFSRESSWPRDPNPSLLHWQTSSLLLSHNKVGSLSLLVSHSSRVWLFVTLWTIARQASLSITIPRSFLKLMFIGWLHLTILSSVIPFSCFQSFPVSGSFPMSQLFASRGQSIRASASAWSFQWIFRVDFL